MGNIAKETESMEQPGHLLQRLDAVCSNEETQTWRTPADSKRSAGRQPQAQ